MLLLLIYTTSSFAHAINCQPDPPTADSEYNSLFQKTSAQWPKKLRLLLHHAINANEKFVGTLFSFSDEPAIFAPQYGKAFDLIRDNWYKNEFLSFQSMVKNSEAGLFPPVVSENEFAQADKELNAVYSNIMNTLKIANRPLDKMDKCSMRADQIEPPHGIFCADLPDPSELKEAQRAWITYRDAWVAFAAARYPSVPVIAWKMKLTQERVAHLKKVQVALPHFLDSSSPDYDNALGN